MLVMLVKCGISYPGTFCNPGEEYIGTTCVPCQQGYYKDNFLVFSISSCAPCSNGLITASTGSMSPDDCNVAGEFIKQQLTDIDR